MVLTVLHLRNATSGQPYRKTLQYGFCLQEAVDAMAGRKKPQWRKPRWLEDQQTNEIRADMYACGFIGPNYPVPATANNANIANFFNTRQAVEWFNIAFDNRYGK